MRYLVGWILGVAFGATLTGAVFVAPPLIIITAIFFVVAVLIFVVVD
jgi:chromate transport protein ChrA